MPEMLKVGGEVVSEWLVKLFNEVWGSGVAPRDWKSAIIVPVQAFLTTQLESGNQRKRTMTWRLNSQPMP